MNTEPHAAPRLDRGVLIIALVVIVLCAAAMLSAFGQPMVFSWGSGTAPATNIYIPALATKTTSGSITTNVWALTLQPPEVRAAVWKTPPLIISPYELKGINNTETDYWDYATGYVASGMAQLWGTEAYMLIEDGWQGAVNGAGYIYENSNNFPSGLAATVNKSVGTNSLSSIIYTENRLGDSSIAGNVGAWGNWDKWAYVFATNGLVGVRMDSPPSYTAGYTNWNRDTAYGCRQMGYWMEQFTGQPCPMFSTGWNYTNELQTLGAVNGWYIVGHLGDVGGTAPYALFTNWLPHIWFSLGYSQFAGKSCWQNVEYSFMYWNPAYYEANCMWSGTVLIPRAYTYAESPSAFNQQTNSFLKRILDDWVEPPWIIGTNGTTIAMGKKLSNGDRAVWFLNMSTNANGYYGVSGDDLKWNASGISLVPFECLYCTNAPIGTVLTNGVIPPMGSLLYRVAARDPNLLPQVTSAPISITNQIEVVHGLSLTSYQMTGPLSGAVQSASPYYWPFGWYQSNAGSDAYLYAEIPEWATQVAGGLFIQCSGTQAFTNTISTYYASMANGRQSQFYYQVFPIVCGNGLTYFSFTNLTINTQTNVPRTLIMDFGPSTNTAARYFLTPLHLTYN